MKVPLTAGTACERLDRDHQAGVETARTFELSRNEMMPALHTEVVLAELVAGATIIGRGEGDGSDERTPDPLLDLHSTATGNG